MDFSIDMISIGSADASIVWIKENNIDYIVFIDGGNPSDGEKVLTHYNTYIKPHVPSNVERIIINSHPHQDHIGGLFEIVEHFKTGITRVYINNPLDYISVIQRNIINEYYLAPGYHSKQLTKIYESLEDSQQFDMLLKKYGIPKFKAFSNIPLDHTLFQFLGPSESFYKKWVHLFSDSSNISKISLLKESETIINELDEGLRPCEVVDEVNDTSAENLTCTLVQFTDSSSRRYLFTGDAGVDSFEAAQSNNYDLSGFHIVQLPHHGGRRNINTNWIGRFSPDQYWISAIGDKKHPRKAVIECIKKNVPKCKTYSTHKGGTKHINSKANLFPERGWTDAVPL